MNTAAQPSAMNSEVMSQRGTGRQAGRQMSRARIPAAAPPQMTASTLGRIQPRSARTTSGVQVPAISSRMLTWSSRASRPRRRLPSGDRWYAADTPNRDTPATAYTAAASLAGPVGASVTSTTPAAAATGNAPACSTPRSLGAAAPAGPHVPAPAPAASTPPAPPAVPETSRTERLPSAKPEPTIPKVTKQ